jgi:hypothetical protein
MDTRTLPHTIVLHRGPAAAVLDQLAQVAQGLHSAWIVHRARRAAEAAERDLMQLDPRTLQDIGAPEGLVGQQRWWDEQQEARNTDRLLEMRGW